LSFTDTLFVAPCAVLYSPSEQRKSLSVVPITPITPIDVYLFQHASVHAEGDRSVGRHGSMRILHKRKREIQGYDNPANRGHIAELRRAERDARRKRRRKESKASLALRVATFTRLTAHTHIRTLAHFPQARARAFECTRDGGAGEGEARAPFHSPSSADEMHPLATQRGIGNGQLHA